jgi:hypothetical protein
MSEQENTMNMLQTVKQLKNEQQRIQKEMDRVRAALESLTGGKPRSGRRLSAAARAKIAKAQRERWRKIRGKRSA